ADRQVREAVVHRGPSVPTVRGLQDTGPPDSRINGAWNLRVESESVDTSLSRCPMQSGHKPVVASVGALENSVDRVPALIRIAGSVERERSLGVDRQRRDGRDVGSRQPVVLFSPRDPTVGTLEDAAAGACINGGGNLGINGDDVRQPTESGGAPARRTIRALIESVLLGIECSGTSVERGGGQRIDREGGDD